MQHSFDIDIATAHGINIAIFLNNIAFWTEKNIANNRHFYDGRYWTYNSQQAFSIIFPYWSRQNLRTIINQCVEKKLIILGNYNENKYDHTSWYSLTNEGLNLFPHLQKSLKSSIGWNQPIDVCQSTNQVVRTNQSSYTDIKPYRERVKNKKPLSKKWMPNTANISRAKDVSIKCNKTVDQLITKFKNIKVSKNAVSSDWDLDFENFLIDERPSFITMGIKNTKPTESVNRYANIRDFTQERLDREINNEKRQ